MIKRLIKENYRISNADTDVYDLRSDEPREFVKRFKNQKVDIFFTDDNKAHVVKRLSNLTWHGEDGKFNNIDKILYVYAGLEDEFYYIDDFSKLIKNVYRGKYVRLNPISGF